MKKLAIVSSHPIQYNAPLFRLLAQRNKIALKVFYTWSQTETGIQFDPGFGESVSWDLPLLEGYPYSFVENTATDPGTHHFKGIVNPALNKTIEAWQADAVLVFGWSFDSHLKCMRYFHKKIPIYFRGDSTLLNQQGALKKILRTIFLKWVYHFVDAAFYVGTHNKAYFKAHGLQMKQLVYAPHAVDNDRFAQPEKEYQQQADVIKNTLGIKYDDIVLLFAGKLQQGKNPEFLIKVLKAIPDCRLKLIFVGNGELLPIVKAAADEDDRIKLLGFQNQRQMPVMYRIADLFVLPSSRETWGLALNEAMACGKSVAATAETAGSVDLINEGSNGVIINLDEVKLFERFLLTALSDKSILTNMGKQSVIKIKSFTFQHIVEAIEQSVNN